MHPITIAATGPVPFPKVEQEEAKPPCLLFVLHLSGAVEDYTPGEIERGRPSKAYRWSGSTGGRYYGHRECEVAGVPAYEINFANGLAFL